MKECCHTWQRSNPSSPDHQMDAHLTEQPWPAQTIVLPKTKIDILIATDKRGYPYNIFLISPRKHMLWVLIRSALVFSYFFAKTYVVYSLEAPRRGASNEYPQHMFSWRNKKDISIFRVKKTPYLLLCILLRCFGMPYINLI